MLLAATNHELTNSRTAAYTHTLGERRVYKLSNSSVSDPLINTIQYLVTL
jgi:hypothetical protein